MGRAAPGCEVFVLDPKGQPVSPGAVGDLFIRGIPDVSLFQEYVDDPQATQAAFRSDGQFITGDRVRLGLNGELYFADRSKDMLKVGGSAAKTSRLLRLSALSSPFPAFANWLSWAGRMSCWGMW
jgi:carnitine-CoA ligase